MLAEPGEGPIVLALAPTRELAVQIQLECAKFGQSSKIKSTCIYGGAAKGPQVGRPLGLSVCLAPILPLVAGEMTSTPWPSCVEG